MATSALEIIRPALRKIGAIDAIETPGPEHTAVALECLNGLIDSWQSQSATAINSVEKVVALPASTTTLAIGPGLAVDVARPFRVESCYARIFNIDRPVHVVSKQDYDAVVLKDMGTSWPEVVWYDGGVPTGNLYFWPRANAGVEIHVTLLRYVASFADANATQDLPQGHKRALTLALAVEVAPEFALEPSVSLQKRAALAYKAITRANFQVPEMEPGVRVTARLGQFLSGGM